MSEGGVMALTSIITDLLMALYFEHYIYQCFDCHTGYNA
jgi:hypothetical protein